eukprot:8711229-Pyramimonas_sp.AAC.1
MKEDGVTMRCGTGDLPDFYYTLELGEEIAPYFVLPRCFGGRAGRGPARRLAVAWERRLRWGEGGSHGILVGVLDGSDDDGGYLPCGAAGWVAFAVGMSAFRR